MKLQIPIPDKYANTRLADSIRTFNSTNARSHLADALSWTSKIQTTSKKYLREKREPPPRLLHGEFYSDPKFGEWVEAVSVALIICSRR